MTNQETDKISVLYVDDEENNLRSFKATFRKIYKVHTAISGEEGLEVLKNNEIQIIITDQRMPEMTGIEFLTKVLDFKKEPMRMLLTGYSDINAVIDSINKGEVYRYLTKPWNENELRSAIESAYEVFALRKENKELLKKLEIANDQLEFLLRQRLLS
ncbi:response regulator [Phaeocystidibacter luteus]|uniref:Response regulator n=1 Tax=Phaeocystidibacter luteus TaxID=911197 RepID=A0A6N6RJI8_9FLAO|nr:response regulator [Phaeocystidibacter luteus]KAB2814244.1 response regulator [Phaeocystidibacter luteus]